MGVTTILIYTVIGFLVGLSARFAFLRMPDSWLLDYDQVEIPDGFDRMRAFPFYYQGLGFACLTAVLHARIPGAVSGGWEIAAALLAIPTLMLILVADWKTRIIPDQLTLLLIVPGLLRMVGDLSAGTSFIRAVGRPLLAALIAGGSLLLIGLLGQWMLRREAMGMGDVKMIAAAAFVTGLDRLLALVLLSFLTAALIAIPLMAKRMIHNRRKPAEDDIAVGNSQTTEVINAEGVETDERSQVNDAGKADEIKSDENSHEQGETEPEEDTAIAFGPFIAIATLLLILFSRQVDFLITAYLNLILG